MGANVNRGIQKGYNCFTKSGLCNPFSFEVVQNRLLCRKEGALKGNKLILAKTRRNIREIGSETLAFNFVSLIPFDYICAVFMKSDKLYKMLIAHSREMFMKHGLKSLTMDTIARDLGMSKKTIYQFVEK